LWLSLGAGDRQNSMPMPPLIAGYLKKKFFKLKFFFSPFISGLYGIRTFATQTFATQIIANLGHLPT
jgi:hypothetical protein